MKNKQLLLASLIGLFILQLTSNAQVNLSGSFGVNYVKNGNYRSAFSYNLTPKIGFGINSNVEIGGFLNYSGISLEYTNNDYYDDEEITEKIDVTGIGVYSRFTLINSEKIRLLFEPSIQLSTAGAYSDYIIGITAVPVVQLRISEKVSFDMTLGLMGMSIVSMPSSDFLEFNLGLNNNTNLSSLGLNRYVSSAMMPLQLGFTYTL